MTEQLSKTDQEPVCRVCGESKDLLPDFAGYHYDATGPDGEPYVCADVNWTPEQRAKHRAAGRR